MAAQRTLDGNGSGADALYVVGIWRVWTRTGRASGGSRGVTSRGLYCGLAVSRNLKPLTRSKILLREACEETRRLRMMTLELLMASLRPFPLSPNLDYILLHQFVEIDPSRFVLGPSFVDDAIPKDFSLSTEGLPLMADAIHLSSWYVSTTSKSSGKSLRTWPSVSNAYLAWLNHVEASYADFWREVEIFEAIQLSRTPSIANNLFLATTLYFWSHVSNTFLFKGGHFTPTLLDVVAIITPPSRYYSLDGL
uniref:Aminotransferase-like plant mobile domain-containing protein n=1 Tax=Ananas comosus var. bracteatus TaxID=296719 RepID=A0A6V7NFF5_ANACO|nr:unnamed protein product [Ananas comosus var. bracteatus]